MDYIIKFLLKIEYNPYLVLKWNVTNILYINDDKKKIKEADATILGRCCETSSKHIAQILKLK